MTSLSNAFALYNRLEQHLKRASNDRPLTVNTAFHLGDIQEIAGGPHNVQTAFESLTRKGLVTKVLMGDRPREGKDKNSKVAYFWTPEKVEEHVPPLSSGVGIRYPNRKKPTRTGKGAQYESQRGQPALDIPASEANKQALLKALRATPMGKDIESTLKDIKLDFGNGNVFTAPEGCKVNVNTNGDGSIVVAFHMPAPTGN